MKRGFTLLELIIVIIIIGILATLGFTQYARIIEKSRGAEAKGILGDLRRLAAGYRLEHGAGSLATMIGDDLGLGMLEGDIPSPGCKVSHYFYYSFSCTDPSCTFTADRCTSGGKAPDGPKAGYLKLTTDFSTGVDSYASDAGY